MQFWSQVKKGFTLVEMMFVIAIVAILLAILLPAMNSARESASKTRDIANLKKIAEAWRVYTLNRGFDMAIWDAQGWSFADYGNWFAWSLAGAVPGYPNRSYSERCVLNDPGVYVSSKDKYASEPQKEFIVKGAVDGGSADIDTGGWTAVSSEDFVISTGYPYLWSYCTVANLGSSTPEDTTPLAFTRGLKKDGTWDEKYGLYGSKGGFVVFCDGHVTWFDGDKPATFLKWDKSGYTNNLYQAVPNKARIGNGGISSYNGNLVIYGFGEGGE